MDAATNFPELSWHLPLASVVYVAANAGDNVKAEVMRATTIRELRMASLQ